MEKLSDVQTIDHPTLVQLVQLNAIHEISVVGQKQSWQIMVKCGQEKRYLSAINSKQTRTFRKLETAIFYLEKLGIRQIMVNIIDYDPAINKRVRPDRTEALKKIHRIAKTASTLKSESRKRKHID